MVSSWARNRLTFRRCRLAACAWSRREAARLGSLLSAAVALASRLIGNSNFFLIYDFTIPRVYYEHAHVLFHRSVSAWIVAFRLRRSVGTEVCLPNIAGRIPGWKIKSSNFYAVQLCSSSTIQETKEDIESHLSSSLLILSGVISLRYISYILTLCSTKLQQQMLHHSLCIRNMLKGQHASFCTNTT